ncbi:MAG: hypothetical protein ACI38Q_04035 [Candidatus Bruticola sp.]
MVPLQFFLIVASAIFSLGLYCLLSGSSKTAYLIGGQFCFSGVCLALAAAARYVPNQEALIFNLVIGIYSVGQLATAAFFLSCSSEQMRAQSPKN